MVCQCCSECSTGGTCENGDGTIRPAQPGQCGPGEGCACDNCGNCIPVPYVGCFNYAYLNPATPGAFFFPCNGDADCSPGCFCVFDLVMHLSQGGTLNNFFPSVCVPRDHCSECDPETEDCIDYEIFCNQADALESKADLEANFSHCNSFNITTGQPVGGSIAYYVSACCPKVFP